MSGEIAATAVATPQTQQPSQAGNTSQGPAASPSGTVQAQNPEPLKASAIPDPKAFLDNWRAKHGWKTAGNHGSSSASAKPSQSAQAAPAQGAEPKTPVAGATTPPLTDAHSETNEPKDDLAARVAKFSREERDFAAQREAFKAEQARAKAEREESTKQQEAKLKQAETADLAIKAIESGDAVGAVKILKGDMNPSAFALQLLEQLQLNDERPMSQAEVDRIVSDKLKAQEEERAKAEEAKRKENEEKRKASEAATLDKSRELYVSSCHAAFDKTKHPFIAAHGLPSSEILKYVEGNVDERGMMQAPPMADELLDHFEKLYRTRAERAGWAPKTVEVSRATQPASLSPSSLVQDSGGRLANPEPVKGLNAQREEMKRRLRLGGVQT